MIGFLTAHSSESEMFLFLVRKFLNFFSELLIIMIRNSEGLERNWGICVRSPSPLEIAKIGDHAYREEDLHLSIEDRPTFEPLRRKIHVI